MLCPFGQMGLQTIPPECSITQILARAYKRDRECLDFLIKIGVGRISPLTVRLRRVGSRVADR